MIASTKFFGMKPLKHWVDKLDKVNAELQTVLEEAHFVASKVRNYFFLFFFVVVVFGVLVFLKSVFKRCCQSGGVHGRTRNQSH